MANNKFYFFFFFFFFLLGCNRYNSYYMTQANNTLNKQRKDFGKESVINNLLGHFPKRIKNDSVIFHSYPPSCPPTYKCSAQYGEVIFIVNTSDYQIDKSNLLLGKIAYKTYYNDSNVIINLFEFGKNTLPIEKCNKWYANKLPIPYFEGYDFGLGKKEVKKVIEGEESPHFNYTHNIPTDIQVYVIKAEAGDFWKESCNEKRPESLKEWQHGYSKGFAISEKENMLIYWTMIW